MYRTAMVLVSSLALVLLLVSSSGLARAQEQAWDQEEVTRLATQMAEEVKQMRIAVRMEPHIIAAGNPTKQRQARVYLDKLKMLKAATAKLSRELAAGQTREQTASAAGRVDALLRDIRQQATKLHATAFTDQYMDPVLGLAAQLRAFYGLEIPTPSEAAPGEAVSE